MEALRVTLEWVSNLTFLAVALWALLRWRRSGGDQSGWLAATFLSLAGAILIGVVIRDLPDSTAVRAAGKVSLLLLLPFPWLLLRFLDSFEGVPQAFRRAGGIAVLATMAYGILLPNLDEEAAATSGVIQVFIVVFLGVWVVLLAYVARRFWRAGRGQPTMVRRRLRTLSLASISLSVALLLAGTQSAEDSGLTLVLQLFSLASAGLFLLGFAPPPQLRLIWRQPEEREFHDASSRLMGATRPQEVADLLVPHLRTVIAARAAAMVHAGEVVASSEATEEDLVGVTGGHAGSSEFPLSNGTIHVWVNAYTPFFGEEEYALLGRLAVLADLALDRTALMDLETQARIELQATNDELESFVYSASHDLKSPLIALLSYIDLLRSDYQDALDDDGRWYLERMGANCHFMESLVTDLLELSRVGRVETTSDVIDLPALIEDIATEATRRHPALRVETDPLPRLYMNDVRVRQLFTNLIDNAAAYAGREDVVIRIFTRPTGPGDDGALIVVRDNGKGIPIRYQDRVFGVFERLEAEDDDSGGTGMGLAICRKIAESVGGTIRLTEFDDGAEFEIHLPARALADRVVAATHQPTEVLA